MTPGPGWDMLVIAGVAATAVVLVRAGVMHMLDPTPLAASLGTRSGHRWLPAAVRTWGLVETGLGGGLVAAVVWPGLWATSLTVAAVLVLVGYSVWLSVRARSSQPWCSCTSSRTPINSAAILRPLVMAAPVAVLAALSSSGSNPLAGMGPVEMITTCFAGLGLGLVGWFYPEAVAVPTARQRLGLAL